MVAGDRAADRIGELVDLLAAAALGNRDQQAIGVLGVLAAERVAGGDAALGAVVEDGGNGSVQLDRELACDRRLVQQLDPLDRGQPLARIGGALDEQLAELAEIGRAWCRERV